MTDPGVPAPAQAGAGPVDRHEGSAPEAAPSSTSPHGSARRPDGATDGSTDGPVGDATDRVEAAGDLLTASEPAVADAPVERWSWPMLAVGAAVIGVDQLTKWWAQRELADGHTVRVVGTLLQFELTYNSGMAFSRGTGLGPVIGVVAVVVIVVLLASLRREASRLAQVALAAVIGGAVGNLLDRLFRSGDGFLGGSVVDFIRLPHWPYFNVADMGVTLGGITLVLGAWRSGRTGAVRPASGPRS